MPDVDNFVRETTTTTGTGNITLSSETGFRQFSQAFSTGGTDVFWYSIRHQGANEWEFGSGHLSDSTTLVRDTVEDSSNSDSAVNFSSGTKDVLIDLPEAHIQDHGTGDSPTFAGASLDGAVTINESGADADFRVEGSTDTDLIRTDAGNDRVGIGTSSPAKKLDVHGIIKVQRTDPIYIWEDANGNEQARITGDVSTGEWKFGIQDSGGANNIRFKMQGVQGSPSGGPIIIDSSGNVDVNGGRLLNANLQLPDDNGDGSKWEIQEDGAGHWQMNYGGTEAWLLTNNGSVLRNTQNGWSSATGTNAIIDSGGDLQKDSGSSHRFKSEIEDADVDMDHILALQPRHFYQEQVERYEYGFVAEEVMDVDESFEQYVTYTEEDGEEKVSGLRYDRMVPLAFEGIQHLYNRIEELEEVVQTLKEAA